METNQILDELFNRYPELSHLSGAITNAFEMLVTCYSSGGKVLVCGNGGSCSDAEHIVGELMKSFEAKRPMSENQKKVLSEIYGERGIYLGDKLEQGLPAISLTSHISLITAVSNDIDPDLIFAQQVVGYGNPADVLIGISSSGNSQNVVDALATAKATEMKTIGLTGETGGKMKSYSDMLINVPGTRTAFVQELQLPVYHALCMMVENHFFKTN